MCPQSFRHSHGRRLLVHHVAKRLGVAPRTVRWWAETGQIRAYRISRKIWGFNEAAVEEFRLLRRRRLCR